MAAPAKAPVPLDTLAFQVILHKLVGLEQAMQIQTPLLQKIVDQLEAQAKQPEVPVATWAQTYTELQATPAVAVPAAAPGESAPPPKASWRWWRWFVRGESHP